MSSNQSQYVNFPDELSATMTGGSVVIGSLQGAAIWLSVDNQGTAEIAVYVNGSANPWKTFPAGEAIVVDIDTNRGNAPSRYFPKGTTFSGVGASGDIKISYLTAGN